MAKQGRADELMAMVAPACNSHVKEGELSSWGWLEHTVGGEYRRRLTLRGANTKSVLAAWGVINDQIDQENKAASTEFSEIYYTHQDCIWDIVH